MRREIIQKLTNVVYVNHQYVRQSGVFNGKLGIAIYLYSFFRKSNSFIYKDLADELIDSVLEEVNIDTPLDFYFGLSGVGWGINYLLKNKYLSEDEDDILEDFDEKIYLMNENDYTQELKNENCLFSKGLYFIDRYDNEKKKNVYISCEEFIRNSDFDVLSLNYLNSILFFVIKFHSQNDDFVSSNYFMDKLYTYVEKSINNQQYNASDLIVFELCLKRIIENDKIKCDKIKWNELIFKLNFNYSVYDIVSSGYFWKIFVYSDLNFDYIEIQDDCLDDFISNNILIKNMTFDGLSGLGFMLSNISYK